MDFSFLIFVFSISKSVLRSQNGYQPLKLYIIMVNACYLLSQDWFHLFGSRMSSGLLLSAILTVETTCFSSLLCRERRKNHEQTIRIFFLAGFLLYL